MTEAYELNIDGLVGPTCTLSGLSYGNEASYKNQNEISNPQQAALQGLAKMAFLMRLGIKQVIMPPHERPHLATLHRLGFRGTPETVLSETKRYAPWLLRYVSSVASMWTANSAHITPSIDTVAKKVQITPANLHSKFHRSIEPEMTGRILKAIFHNPIFFEHHSPLPAHELFSDEGAANHTRFAKSHFSPGIHLFVYGNTKIAEDEIVPQKYPARQSKQASEAICKLHRIYDKQYVIAQQNPQAIDAGVFHNDVISTGNLNLFLCHEEAFTDTKKVINELQEKLNKHADVDLHPIIVPSSVLSLEDAVKSYLFNSQIISLPDGSMTILAPAECLEVPAAYEFLQNLVMQKDNPIVEVHYLDLRQSMKNGGGPACLRIRAVLNENELSAMNENAILTEDLYRTLVSWVKQHYRERLYPRDLSDPMLYKESCQALDALTQILKLGNLYSFQR